MVAGVLEEEVGGEDAAEQGGVEEERGDSTEEEVLPSTEWTRKAIREWQALEEEIGQWQVEDSEAEVELTSEGEEMTQNYDPHAGSLDLELAAQHEAAQRLQQQEVEEAAAARRRSRSDRQRGVDLQEGMERVIWEWQEWKDQQLLEEQTEAALQGQRRSGRQGVRGGRRGEGSQGRGQCGVPGMAGDCTGSQREDGGASPSEWAQGDIRADGGRGEHRGDSSGGGGRSSHTGEEEPGGRQEAGQG